MSTIGGAIAAITGVLAMGGALRSVQAVLALLVGAALVPLVTSRRHLARCSPLVAVLGVAVALTTVQIVPLPASAVELLNPTGATLRADGSAITGSSAWSVLSMDPGSTLRALVVLLMLLGLAVIALRQATSEDGRFRLVATVGLLCAASATVVGAHAALGEPRLYGLHRVRHAVHVLGPLLNLNHLGGLMAIGCVVGIALVAYPRQRAWARASWLAVSSACGAIALYTVSRGAAIAMLAGGLATIAILVAQRLTTDAPRRAHSVLTRSLPITVVAACAMLLAISTGAELIEQKFATTSMDELEAPTSKFAAWRSAMALVEESPWVGVGRGGFESSFTRVHPTSGSTVFSHLENEYLQAVVDWGVPGALALGIAVLWLTIVVLRRWREGPLAAAAIGGLVVLAMQSIVDFGIELPGLAIPATLLAASLAYVPLREVPLDRAARVRAVRVGHVLVLLVGAIILLGPWTASLEEDHERLRQGDTKFISDSLARHPLDYYGYAVAAELAFRRGDPAGVYMLNHALRLNPTHGGLHRLAAQRLRRGGHYDQAAIEYAAALRVMRTPAQVLKEVARDLPLEAAVRAIPLDMPKPRVVTTALVEVGQRELAVRWLRRISDATPDNGQACELLLAFLNEQAEVALARYIKDRCSRNLRDAAVLDRIAKVLSKQRRFEELTILLDDAETSSGLAEHRQRAWMTLCDAYRAESRPEDAAACLRALDASAGAPPALRTQIHTRLELLRHMSARPSAPTPPSRSPEP